MNIFTGVSYREILHQALSTILAEGKEVSPRGQKTLELEDVALVLLNPLDRICLVKERKSNIFATIAETLWVLAARNDVKFISYYLNRMSAFSEDGITIAGAYGPRLRKWYDQDQLANVLNLLQANPDSRRAVMTLFDPQRDQSLTRLDIPCNNLLHFTVRGTKLNLRVYSRSMDVIWGSTINVYEWTTLQENVAYWLGVEVGSYSHFIGSLHIYQEFIDRAKVILSHPVNTQKYNTVRWNIPFDRFDHSMAELIRHAELLQNLHIKQLEEYQPLDTPYSILSVWNQMLLSYAYFRLKQQGTAYDLILKLPDCDLKNASLEFYNRVSERKD